MESAACLVKELDSKRKNSKNPQTLVHFSRREEIGVLESSCEHFIKRKNRQCSHRSAPFSRFCTEHSEENMRKSLERDAIARGNYESRMKELVSCIPDSVIRDETNAVLDKIISLLEDSCPVVLVENDVTGEKSKKRVRNKRVSAPKRMANPFSIKLTPDIDSLNLDWGTVFIDPNLPLHIDVGCAKGKCIENLSTREHRSDWNHLGLEIRSDLVADKCSSGPNLHFIACNFLASADELLKTLPHGCVRLISFQVKY